MIESYNSSDEVNEVSVNIASFLRKKKNFSQIFLHRGLTQLKNDENSFKIFLNLSTCMSLSLFHIIFLKLSMYHFVRMLFLSQSKPEHRYSLSQTQQVHFHKKT